MSLLTLLLPLYLTVTLTIFIPLPDINLNSPNKGLVVDQAESLSDVPVEGAVGNSVNPLPPGLTEEEAEELRTELTKVEPSCSYISRCLHATIG